jgi:hypothetical protein
MKPAHAFLLCAIVSAVAPTRIAPAAPPIAASSAGEPAFQEIQTVVQSLLAKTTRAGTSRDAPSRSSAGGQTFAAGAAAAPGSSADTPPSTTVKEYQAPPAPGSARSGDTTYIAWDAGEPAVARLLEQTNADLAYLRGLSASIAVPPAYADNVRQQEAVLLDLGAQQPLSPRGLAKLQAVTADFHVKALHAQKIIYGDFTNGSAFSPIQVRVHTYKQGKERGGYEVWYVAAAYEDDRGRFQRFLRLSSPTSLPLTVGNYSMWAAAPGGAAGAHQILAIGAGTPSQDLDLTVP